VAFRRTSRRACNQRAIVHSLVHIWPGYWVRHGSWPTRARRPTGQYSAPPLAGDHPGENTSLARPPDGDRFGGSG